MGDSHVVSNIIFKPNAGVPYGEIYAIEVATQISIAASGTHYQVTSWTANGRSNLTTPEFGEGHVKIDKAGVYLVTVSISCKSISAGAIIVHADVRKNNGASVYDNIHAHRYMSGGGLDRGSISLSGILNATVNDTVELWVANNTNTNNITVEDANLSVVHIGGVT